MLLLLWPWQQTSLLLGLTLLLTKLGVHETMFFLQYCGPSTSVRAGVEECKAFQASNGLRDTAYGSSLKTAVQVNVLCTIA